MTLVIAVVDGHGLSNEVHHELLPKNTKVMQFHSKRHFNSCTILTKTECFRYKSGHAMWVAKLLKEDCPIVLK